MSQLEEAIALSDILISLAEKHALDDTEDSQAAMFEEEAERLRGFTLLGKGYFSMVFSHDKLPSLVVKFCPKGIEDSGIAYLAWARAHPGPHVPRVHHIKRHGPYYVAVLDRLNPLNSDGHKQYSAWLSDARWNLGYSIENTLSATALRISQFFEGAAEMDLHDQNCMQDLNGVVIITDPLSYSKTPESRALRTGIERAFLSRDAA